MRSGQEPTLADVAALAGVSPTTVSRVLNNRGYLSEKTKDAVAKAIEELNYHPNEVARSLLGSRTHIVGIIVPTVAHPFFGELAAALENALAQRGYRALLCNSLGQADRERDYLRQLEGRRVDGLITGAHSESIEEYKAARLPIVMVDRQLAEHIPNVRSDNFEGGVLAAQLLLERGCRHPVLVTSTLGPQNRRETGFRAELAEAGIEPGTISVKFGTPEPEYSRQLEKGLEQHRHKMDAVFATDDLTACSVASWLQRNGLRMPEDVKIVGFDGTAAIRAAAPWLSTVAQPITLIAQTAVDLLVERIEGGGEEAPQLIELPVTMVESVSTGGMQAHPPSLVPPSIWSF